MREAFTTWMMLKLLAVGVMVMIHIRAGYLILNLFKPKGHYAQWRRWSITAATLGMIGTILVLILSKPAIELTSLPPWLRQPGGLQSLVDTIRPTP
jgi:uncharacterized membrane protein